MESISDVEFIVAVKYEGDHVLSELSKYGEIEYKSPVLNVVYLKTNKYKELFEIDGVIDVNESTKGRIYQ